MLVCGRFFTFHNQRTEDYSFKNLRNVLDVHTFFQIFIPVDISIELKTHKREPEPVKRLVIKFHRRAVNWFEQIGKCKRMLKTCDHSRIDRDWCFLTLN